MNRLNDQTLIGTIIECTGVSGSVSILFLILKLTGCVICPWWYLTIPMWPIIIGLILLALFY